MTEPLVARVVAGIVAQRDLLQTMQAEFRSTSARVVSADRTVAVEVNGLGAVTGLWLGRQAYRGGPDALAAVILETAHAAAKIVSDRQNYLATEITARMSGPQGRIHSNTA